MSGSTFANVKCNFTLLRTNEVSSAISLPLSFIFIQQKNGGGGGGLQLPQTLPLRGPWKKKETKYQHRNKTAHRPEIKTDRFKNVFVNRLMFRYHF